ncbi:MAG TPA: hypothetical protein PLA90_17210 [Candidatus Sumerlaeota bacterium]|nr:hypothetical protein [Candidatus Sumerlaeota bacterium]
MRWIPPASEEQWRELLSERLDGELDPESAQALDDYLTIAPERAGQLAELRRTSNLLQEWEVVEVPHPGADFLGRLEAEARPSFETEVAILPVPIRKEPFPFSQVLRYAAMFLVGALLGGVSVKQLERLHPSQPEIASNRSVEQPVPSVSPSPLSESSIAAISPRQAEQLFRASERELQKRNENAILAATGLNPEEIRARLEESSYAGSERLLRRLRQELEEESHNRRTEL